MTMTITKSDNVIVCGCGVWRLDPFTLDHNDIVILVAQHWINEHDYDYNEVSKWTQTNWRY
jgi:hypothetical protein